MNTKFFPSKDQQPPQSRCGVGRCAEPASAEGTYNVSEKKILISKLSQDEASQDDRIAMHLYFCSHHAKVFTPPKGWEVTFARSTPDKSASSNAPNENNKGEATTTPDSSTPLLDRAFANKRR